MNKCIITYSYKFLASRPSYVENYIKTAHTLFRYVTDG